MLRYVRKIIRLTDFAVCIQTVKQIQHCELTVVPKFGNKILGIHIGVNYENIAVALFSFQCSDIDN